MVKVTAANKLKCSEEVLTKDILKYLSRIERWAVPTQSLVHSSLGDKFHRLQNQVKRRMYYREVPAPPPSEDEPNADTTPLFEVDWPALDAALDYVPINAGAKALKAAVERAEAALDGQYQIVHYLSVPPSAALAALSAVLIVHIEPEASPKVSPVTPSGLVRALARLP